MTIGWNEPCDVSNLSKEVDANKIIELLKVQSEWSAEPKVKWDAHQKNAEVFWDSCKLFICNECTANDKANHNDCDFKTVEEYNKNMKSKLTEEFNLLEDTKKGIENCRPDFDKKKAYANGLLDNIEKVTINAIREKIKEIKGNVEKTVDLQPYDQNVDLIKECIEDIRTTKDSRKVPAFKNVEELKNNSDTNNSKWNEETKRYEENTKHLKLEYDVLEEVFSANVQKIIDEPSQTIEIKSEKCGDLSMSIAFSSSNNNEHTFQITWKVPAEAKFIYKWRHVRQEGLQMEDPNQKFELTNGSSHSFTFKWNGDLAPSPAPVAATPDPNGAQPPAAVAVREECEVKLLFEIMKVNQETVEFFKKARQIMGLVDNFELFLLPANKVTQ
jgi:hypothetical protein